MKGLAALRQRNQEPLWGRRQLVERPTGELGVINSSPWTVVISSFCPRTLLVGRLEGHHRPLTIGCWFVAGDDLTEALHFLRLKLSPTPPSSLALIKSRMETFWYWLTQVHLENGHRNGESTVFLNAV